jgi:mannose-1-phosphate guanylyltransferase/mannose-1-phosphate guanylyltransferase/mannose-6-phosphate isomerase
MFTDCLIMAGGAGSRLWPASNSKTPKQFLAIPGGDSFFTAAVKRALHILDGAGEGRIVIIAGRNHAAPVIAACARFSPEEKRRMVLIPEPAAKNTAPAIACGTVYAARVLGPDRTLLVLTSDHIIEPPASFKADAAAAAAFAREGKLAVFGIPPRSPETGYGYIEAAEALSPGAEGAGGSRVFRVAAFREKPGKAQAEQFLAAGNFYWNAGMFGFSVSAMEEEFRDHAPDLFAPFDGLAAPGEEAYRLKEGLRVLEAWPGLDAAYAGVPAVSFDYAIAEKCRRIVMAAAGFDWFDLGSWDEYARFSGSTAAEVYRSGGEDCFVDADIPVALCGVRDLIVVVRSGKDGGPPGVLIAQRGETQRVKDITEKIRAAGRTELL